MARCMKDSAGLAGAAITGTSLLQHRSDLAFTSISQRVQPHNADAASRFVQEQQLELRTRSLNSLCLCWPAQQQ
jgi:hypothetical protein